MYIQTSSAQHKHSVHVDQLIHLMIRDGSGGWGKCFQTLDCQPQMNILLNTGKLNEVVLVLKWQGDIWDVSCFADYTSLLHTHGVARYYFPPPFYSLSSPPLSSTLLSPNTQNQIFLSFSTQPKALFWAHSLFHMWVFFSLPIQQGHPIHTITPSLHPPELQKRHLLTGSGFGAWLFAPKIPLSPNFFLLLGLGKTAAWGKKNLQLLICISFTIWRSTVVCLRDWIGVEQREKKTTDHTTTTWMDCVFDRSCNQQLRISKLD